MDSLRQPLLLPRTEIPPYAFTFLAITIALEVTGTLILKSALDDVRIYFPAYALYFAGFSMFSFTLRYFPLSVAYTTWCALGTVGVAILSRACYGEKLSLERWICILATLPPVIGLHVLP